jgi:hypothetical protein
MPPILLSLEGHRLANCKITYALTLSISCEIEVSKVNVRETVYRKKSQRRLMKLSDSSTEVNETVSDQNGFVVVALRTIKTSGRK